MPSIEQAKAHIIETYIANVTKIATIANGYGIPTAVFLQPYSVQHLPAHLLHSRNVLELYAQARARYKAEARRNTAMRVFADLTSLSGELRELFVDSVHYKADPGNTIVAKRMVDIMLKEGMVHE